MANDKQAAEEQARGPAAAPKSKPAPATADQKIPPVPATAPPPAAGAAADGTAPTDKAKEARPARSRATRHVATGIAYINATFNNTQVVITDTHGAVIAWSSAGRAGFKGTRKSTAYAATVVAQDAARQAAAYRMQEVEVRVQGPGSGRESAIRALQAAGLTISLIRDVTPIPHNGCRPRKRRRV